MTIQIKKDSGVLETTTMPVFLPERIVHHLMSACKFSLDDNLVRGYWAHLDHMGDEWAKSTADFRRHSGLVWPIGIYGDEAVIGLQADPTNKIFGLYMNMPLFRPRATRLSRYLLFALETNKLVSARQSVFPALKIIVDSFNRLAEHGILGRRFLLAEIRGDQVFHKFLFKHASWWKANNVCFRCHVRADRPGTNLCYTQYDNSGWGYRTTDQFLREEMPMQEEDRCFLVIICNFLVRTNIFKEPTSIQGLDFRVL